MRQLRRENGALRSELEKTRETLRSTQSALAAFQSDEHAALSRRVDELSAELAEWAVG